MKILLTNDDGIYSAGLIKLALELEKEHEIFVVAPDRERSATGHAITIHHPLRVEETRISKLKKDVYVIDGTPSDCVKLGLEVLNKDIDMVVSGINRGPNLGNDVFYSGTVSAAIEGGMKGLPALALSLVADQDFDFSYAVRFVKKFISSWKDIILKEKPVLNINIPSLPEEEINGIKVVKLGFRRYENIFKPRKDPRGRTYYWMAGEVKDQLDDPETDLVAIKNNFITVTPLKTDLTDNTSINRLKRLQNKEIF